MTADTSSEHQMHSSATGQDDILKLLDDLPTELLQQVHDKVQQKLDQSVTAAMKQCTGETKGMWITTTDPFTGESEDEWVTVHANPCKFEPISATQDRCVACQRVYTY